MKIKNWINEKSEFLKIIYDNDITIAKRKIFLLLNHFYKINFPVFENELIDEDKMIFLDKIIDQMVIDKKPIEYILKETCFLESLIKIEQPILIPRVETEFICDILFKKIEQKKDKLVSLLDLGAGSGCIGISFLKRFNHGICLALDINKQACILSLKNAIKNNVENRYNILQEDMLLFLEKNNEKFDLIISNPPYISLNEYNKLDDIVKKWEDKFALTDEKDGNFYIKNILNLAYKNMKEESILLIEIDSLNYKFILNYARNLGLYKNIEILFDQYEKERAIILDKK
jgi:release factor glutamine methyltransferase